MKIPTSRLGIGAIAAAASVAWLATTAAAAPRRGANEVQASEAGTQAFGETVDVQLVNVEIWVTDRQGNPIGPGKAEPADAGRNAGPSRRQVRDIPVNSFLVVTEGAPGFQLAPRPRFRIGSDAAAESTHRHH